MSKIQFGTSANRLNVRRQAQVCLDLLNLHHDSCQQELVFCHSQPVVTLPRLENYCPSGATQAFFRLWRRTEKPLCSSSSPTLLLCHPQWEGNKADTEKSWEDRGMVSYICTVLTKEDLGLISSSATHLLDDVGESSSLNLFHHFLMKEGGREGKGRRWEDRREKQGDGGGEKRRNMNSL